MKTDSGPVALDEFEIETVTGLDPDSLSALRDFGLRPTVLERRQRAGLAAWGNLARILAVVAAVSTTPITRVDPRDELFLPGSSSITWTVQIKLGQKITLRQARELALKIGSETDRRLAEERYAEARFLLELWEDEKLTTL